METRGRQRQLKGPTDKRYSKKAGLIFNYQNCLFQSKYGNLVSMVHSVNSLYQRYFPSLITFSLIFNMLCWYVISKIKERKEQAMIPLQGMADDKVC